MPLWTTIAGYRAAGLFALTILSAGVNGQVPEKFTNLQILPKNISRDRLVETMRGFSFSLAERCEYCHAGKDSPSLAGMDFASDRRDAKRTAREMMRMVAAINRDYFGGSNPSAATKVECVTCHRGAAKPRTLQAVLTEALQKGGVASAISEYRRLRKESYGNGQFDFSETSLNLLAESLTHEGKSREAAAMMELNAEVNEPLSKWGYGVLAMAHQSNGELEKAEADFKRLLDMDPQDSWAAESLRKIRDSRVTR